MIKVSFDDNLKKYGLALAETGRQAPYATMLVLNDLAFQIRAAEAEKMGQVFKSPRPQTLRNIRVRKATKTNLRASIFFNQIWDWDEYMVAQVEGGVRPMKRSEKVFGRYYVPGAGAQLDQSGDIKGSQIQQIMSHLQKFSERGFKMNRTVGRQTALGRGKIDYFMIDKAGQGLRPGVYMRVDKGHGQMMYARALSEKARGVKKSELRAKQRGMLERGVIPVLIFVNKPPVYRARFPFHDVANRVIDANAERVIRERVTQVMLSAR